LTPISLKIEIDEKNNKPPDSPNKNQDRDKA